MKTCITCKHWNGDEWYPLCNAKRYAFVDPVTGDERHRGQERCAQARNPVDTNNGCGPDGELFEPRPVEPTLAEQIRDWLVDLWVSCWRRFK